MRKQVLGHVSFWALLILIDMSGYFAVWSKKVGEIAAVNYSWILAVFYITYIAASSFFNSDKDLKKITGSRSFWIIAAMPVVYIAGTMLSDMFVLQNYYAATIWNYCVSRVIMIYPFIGSAIFLAGYKTRAIQFRSIRKERNDLIVENNYLREEREELLKGNNLLQFEVIAKRAELDELHREYHEKFNRYREILRRMRDGDL